VTVKRSPPEAGLETCDTAAARLEVAPVSKSAFHAAPTGARAGRKRFVFGMIPAWVAGMRKRSVVRIAPEIMSGMPCFAGTRVPVRALIDYIEGGETLDVFLEQYPSVSREKAVAFLEESSASLEKSLQPA
jgi:uncharacterized protein (DUF433 family)